MFILLLFPACLCNILTILIPRATWGCYLQSFPLQSSSDSLAKGGKWIQDWTKAKGEDSTFYHYSTSNLNRGAEDLSVWLEQRRKSFLKRSVLTWWSRIMKVYQYTFELPVKAYRYKFLGVNLSNMLCSNVRNARAESFEALRWKYWQTLLSTYLVKSHSERPHPTLFAFPTSPAWWTVDPPILSSGFYKSNICFSNL